MFDQFRKFPENLLNIAKKQTDSQTDGQTCKSSTVVIWISRKRENNKRSEAKTSATSSLRSMKQSSQGRSRWNTPYLFYQLVLVAWPCSPENLMKTHSHFSRRNNNIFINKPSWQKKCHVAISDTIPFFLLDNQYQIKKWRTDVTVTTLKHGRTCHIYTRGILWHSTMGLLPNTQNCGCACAGNAGNVFPVTTGKRSRHESRHVRDARAAMHAGIAN